MGNWEVIATILGVVTIITGGVVKIFSSRAKDAIPGTVDSVASLPPSSRPPALGPEIHEMDKRLALIEQRMGSIIDDMAALKRMVEQANDKTAKLSEIIIDWLKSSE